MPTSPHRARMRLLRFERSLTQNQVADQIGISRATLNRIESGGAGSLGSRHLLAEYYGTTVRDLFPDLFEEDDELALAAR